MPAARLPEEEVHPSDANVAGEGSLDRMRRLVADAESMNISCDDSKEPCMRNL